MIYKIIFVCVCFSQFLYAEDIFYYKDSQRSNLSPIDSLIISRGKSNIDSYLTDEGVILGVTNKLLVKLHERGSIQEYLDEFNLSIIKNISKKIYLLQTIDKSLTIKVSNQLHEKQGVEYAHPDFIKKRMKR